MPVYLRKHFLLDWHLFGHIAFLLLPVLALLLGGSIYIFLRPSDFVFFNWIRAIGLENILDPGIDPLSHWLFPDWFVYSLPDGLWAFAYACLIIWIWSGTRSWIRNIWILSMPLSIFTSEGLQYLGIIRGTACIKDLLAGLLGIFLAIILSKLIINSNKNEQTITS